MPRVLLIDPDRNALGALQAALGQADFKEIAAVTSGSFALTMLERNRPDLIVSRVRVPDIDGYELCSIVRKDPSMKGVLVLLLASPGDDAPAATLEEKPDQILAGDLPIAAIVSEAARLLQGTPEPVTRPQPAPPARPQPAPPAAGLEGGSNGLRGSLGVMALPDIAQAIALGHKTGQLLVTLPSGRGVIVFDRGRVVHAKFFGLIGETAFAALVVAADGDAHGSFVFNPLETGPDKAGRTINRDLRQLLLSAESGFDDVRADAAVAPRS